MIRRGEQADIYSGWLPNHDAQADWEWLACFELEFFDRFSLICSVFQRFWLDFPKSSRYVFSRHDLIPKGANNEAAIVQGPSRTSEQGRFKLSCSSTNTVLRTGPKCSTANFSISSPHWKTPPTRPRNCNGAASRRRNSMNKSKQKKIKKRHGSWSSSSLSSSSVSQLLLETQSELCRQHE